MYITDLHNFTMLVVYHSNSPELFTKFMIEIISNCRLSNPMQSEVILIENKIMKQWVQIELAKYFGIAANIMFMNIISFIQKMLLEILSDFVTINNFSYDFMYWGFMEILPKVYFHKNCSIIQRYLDCDVDHQKCSQLAEQLAYLFSKYLIYRSDWLDSWQFGKIVDNLDVENQLWQSEIWRMLLQNNNCNFQNFKSLNYCILLFQKNIKKIDKTKLPNRIFIYSVTSMPPIYWKILDLLSYHITIYLWLINPSVNVKVRNYVVSSFDLHKNQKNSVLYYKRLSESKLSIKNTLNINHDKIINDHNNWIISNHSLINSWGKSSKDTLLVMNQLENLFEIQAFVVPKEDSVLHILQRNILKTQNHVSNIKKNNSFFIHPKNNKKYILHPQDRSIDIHVCSNIQREIEVLHDNLLLMLSKDPSLLLEEIVIVIPNLDDYIPAIETVFNNIFNRQLPFSISRQYSISSTHPIVCSVLKILDISNSRFTFDEVLSFLSVSSIASKFNINFEEIKLLHRYVIDSGIRWGLDKETINNFNVPVTDQNTWSSGLKRMLLGYAMTSQDGIWENIVVPYDYLNKDYISIITRLGEFLKILRKWRDRLNYTYPLKEWMSYMSEIINDFFYDANLDSKDNKIICLLKTYWVDILESGIRSGYSKTINVNVLRDQLNRKLRKEKTNSQFLPNVINFCDVKSILYIPYKILCWVGMNNSFPSNELSYSFNLISKKTRLGDSNIRDKNCYAFLLAILLTQRKLYISFIKKRLCYGTDISDYQSIFIDEIIEYIALNFYLLGNQNLNIIQNIECIRQHLFQWNTIVPFDKNNFVFNSKTQSFAKEWLNAAYVNINDSFSIYSNFNDSLSLISIDTIFFSDLYNFYHHPIRTWFQKRLGVYLYKNKNTYKKVSFNDEPFFLEDSYRFELNTKLVNYLLNNKSIDALYQESCCSGKLPQGSFGKLYWMKQYEQMSIFASQIKTFYSKKVYNLNISLEFNKIKLVGQLHSVQNDGLVRWKSFSLSMRDCFLLWIEHLIYCAVGGLGSSRLFGINCVWHFPNFSKSQSRAFLASLVSGYCKGMTMPLLLLYKSGGIWMNQMFDWDNKTMYSSEFYQKKAYQKLIQAWEGSSRYFFSDGESCDPYLRKILPLRLNEQDIQRIIKVSKHYFFNVMKYRML